MRPAFYDSDDPEMYFENPNLYWSDEGGYLLEPGDDGYIPPLPINPQPKVKSKKMKHSKFYPRTQAEQVRWLANFINKLPSYATALGLSTAQLAAIKGDCLWLIYVLGTWLTAVREWALGCTQAANMAQSGSGGTQALPVFTAPTLPSTTTPVALGALDRIFALVQVIKQNSNCTDDIARDLGIVGSEQTGPDPAALLPVITAEIISGQVLVGWDWGGFGDWLDACEIHVDRGDGKGFVMLTIDTTPDYTDTQPFPAAPTKWIYKAIYRLGDAQYGLWSAPVSVTVG